jgi:hypothetical protein
MLFRCKPGWEIGRHIVEFEQGGVGEGSMWRRYLLAIWRNSQKKSLALSHHQAVACRFDDLY